MYASHEASLLVNRETQASQLAACDEDLAQLASDVTELHSELANLREYGESLTRQVADREARVGQQEMAIGRLEHERLEWQQRAEAASTALERAEAGVAALNREVADREEELRLFRVRVEEQDRLRAERDDEEARERESATVAGHVLMVTLASGYHLAHSDEPCPSLGDQIEIDGRSYTVEQAGRSPLPGDERPCVLVAPARL